MPFEDLPYRRERSAPIFDASELAQIKHYFGDLEFLFLNYRISDDEEKKRAGVRYTSVAVERLWRTARAFRDTMCSYEDFKAEIIVLYLEAIAVHSYTRAEFDRLISDRAHTPVRSKTELGEFYQEFLLTSCLLISKGHLGMPEQLHAFLDSLGPRLAIAVCTRLEQTFPDHFPEDPYESHDIYEATRLALAWEHSAPPVEPLHTVPTPDVLPPRPHTSTQPTPPSLAAVPPIQYLPSYTPPDPTATTHVPPSQCAAPLVEPLRILPTLVSPMQTPRASNQPAPPPLLAFPPSRQPPSPTPHNSAPVMYPFPLQPSAPSILSPRLLLLPATCTRVLPAPPQYPPQAVCTFSVSPAALLSCPPPTSTSPISPTPAQPMQPVVQPRAVPPPITRMPVVPVPLQPPLPPPHTFPHAREPPSSVQPDRTSVSCPLVNNQSAPLVNVPRDVLPPPNLTLVLPELIPCPLAPVCAFPSASEPEQSRKSKAINATLDALAKAVAVLQKGLEANLANPSTLAPCAPVRSPANLTGALQVLQEQFALRGRMRRSR